MANSPQPQESFESDPSSRGSALHLQALASRCACSGCPTVYRTNRGTLVIQGYAVSAQQAGIDLPEGEQLVEIPVDLLTEAASAVN